MTEYKLVVVGGMLCISIENRRENSAWTFDPVVGERDVQTYILTSRNKDFTFIQLGVLEKAHWQSNSYKISKCFITFQYAVQFEMGIIHLFRTKKFVCIYTYYTNIFTAY